MHEAHSCSRPPPTQGGKRGTIPGQVGGGCDQQATDKLCPVVSVATGWGGGQHNLSELTAHKGLIQHAAEKRVGPGAQRKLLVYRSEMDTRLPAATPWACHLTVITDPEDWDEVVVFSTVRGHARAQGVLRGSAGVT